MIKILTVGMAAILSFGGQTLSAGSYDSIITPTFLQETFTFTSGESIKFAECKKNSYPTCTYVWGIPSEKDAIKLKYGLAPKGKKLLVIYAKARSQKDFERVLATYMDAVDVKGLNVRAVWSEQRKQLSLITKKSLIVHVNVDDVKCAAPLEKAKIVAKRVLKNL